MDLIQENYREEFTNDNENFNAENSPSSDYLITDGIDGEPSISPRVGDQYQVEIPSLVSEEERVHILNTPIGNNDVNDYSFYTGQKLPIPIIWVHNDKVQSHITINGLPVDDYNINRAISQDSSADIEISVNLFACSTNIERGKAKTAIPLPDVAKAPWSDSTIQNFILGLYIFGKNLVQVQRFVESKNMGDLLSFYYGKFYRSEEQRRWVECRKVRTRRSITGHRIFTGVRQQEFLSRVLPNRPKEVQDTLLEVTKGFTEGTASLEEFIFTLKAMIGTQALVEAVGIGKGKQDLTGIINEPVRSNATTYARAEIPVGKACSSLSTDEIVKFLTGDFRLSKAKANDLFWEAVWPRLLAGGWHSEQPKDICSLTSKNSLVFLIPGVKKFSRKKLTKGNHYFDSVSDVLNKVASDPKVLELNIQQDLENIKAETIDTKAEQNGVSNHRRPCYLQPRVRDYDSESMKFTIVDTSLVQCGKSSKVRELRSLPIDARVSYHPNHRREISNENSSNDQSSSNDTSLNSQNEQSSEVVDKPIKEPKTQINQRAKSRPQNFAGPVSKRHRLNSCSKSFCIPSEKQIMKLEEHFETESSLQTDKMVAIEEDRMCQPLRTFIDLNLHPQDFDSEGPIDMDVDMKGNEPLESNIVLNDDSNINGRRHGTRNRPPTTKALEALACGFFNVRKDKGMKHSRSRSLNSRTSRRTCKNVEAAPNTNPSTIVPNVGLGEYSESTSHATSWFDNSPVKNDRKETHELLGMH